MITYRNIKGSICDCGRSQTNQTISVGYSRLHNGPVYYWVCQFCASEAQLPIANVYTALPYDTVDDDGNEGDTAWLVLGPEGSVSVGMSENDARLEALRLNEE